MLIILLQDSRTLAAIVGANREVKIAIDADDQVFVDQVNDFRREDAGNVLEPENAVLCFPPAVVKKQVCEVFLCGVNETL